MMQGVEVLSIFKAVSATIFNFSAFWWVFGIVIAICICIGCITMFDYDWTVIPFMIIMGALLGTLLGCIAGLVFAKPIAYENHYKVTISEEVPIVEFLDKYEIIKQEDKILTIREKVSK